MSCIQMPNMCGADATRLIRQLGYKGLIVGVTGNSQQSDIDEFTAAGVDKVMTKPLDIERFMTFVDQYHR